jgi:prepilin-type N-terminal cleavage/methylation domain-containing protein
MATCKAGATMRNYRGMTLIEVVMATVILSVVLMMTFMLSNSAVLSFEEKVATANLQTKGEETLKSMEDHIGDAQVLDPITIVQNGNIFYNAQINFQVPVTHVVDPRQNARNTAQNLTLPQAVYPSFAPITKQVRLNSSGNVDPNVPVPGDFYLNLSFGWRDDNRLVTDSSGTVLPLQGPGLQLNNQSDITVSNVNLDNKKLTPNGYMAYRFVMDTNARVGVNGIFSESVEDVDIDGDGQKLTSYAVGYIERSYWVLPVGQTDITAGGTLVPESTYVLGASNVLQPIKGDSAGSAPDALKTNQIFHKVANSGKLDVALWLVSYNQERRIQRVSHCHTSIFLRNSNN